MTLAMTIAINAVCVFEIGSGILLGIGGGGGGGCGWARVQTNTPAHANAKAKFRAHTSQKPSRLESSVDFTTGPTSMTLSLTAGAICGYV
jgi:hypothetical protein